MSRTQERHNAVQYLRAQKLQNPINEVEEHINQVIEALASDIERGMHTVHARGEL